jgi:hypothetical protein
MIFSPNVIETYGRIPKPGNLAAYTGNEAAGTPILVILSGGYASQ